MAGVGCQITLCLAVDRFQAQPLNADLNRSQVRRSFEAYVVRSVAVKLSSWTILWTTKSKSARQDLRSLLKMYQKHHERPNESRVVQ